MPLSFCSTQLLLHLEGKVVTFQQSAAICLVNSKDHRHSFNMGAMSVYVVVCSDWGSSREEQESYTGVNELIGCRWGRAPGDQAREATPTMNQTQRGKRGRDQGHRRQCGKTLQSWPVVVKSPPKTEKTWKEKRKNYVKYTECQTIFNTFPVFHIIFCTLQTLFLQPTLSVNSLWSLLWS